MSTTRKIVHALITFVLVLSSLPLPVYAAAVAPAPPRAEFDLSSRPRTDRGRPF